MRNHHYGRNAGLGTVTLNFDFNHCVRLFAIAPVIAFRASLITVEPKFSILSTRR